GHGFFVGEYLPGGERFEANAGKEAAPRIALSFDREFLLVDVQRPRRILSQGVRGNPLLERPRGPGVLVLGLVVAGLVLGEFEANRVERAEVVEPLLQG